MRLGKIKGRRIILPATVIPPYVLSKKKIKTKNYTGGPYCMAASRMGKS
jgi:hypothetical protein